MSFSLKLEQLLFLEMISVEVGYTMMSILVLCVCFLVAAIGCNIGLPEKLMQLKLNSINIILRPYLKIFLNKLTFN